MSDSANLVVKHGACSDPVEPASVGRTVTETFPIPARWIAGCGLEEHGHDASEGAIEAGAMTYVWGRQRSACGRYSQRWDALQEHQRMPSSALGPGSEIRRGAAEKNTKR